MRQFIFVFLNVARNQGEAKLIKEVKMRKQMRPDLQSIVFWEELRLKILGRDSGFDVCAYWCTEALKELKAYPGHRFKRAEAAVGYKSGVNNPGGISTHRFLVRPYSEGIFVADGTADQLVQACGLGYYGFIDDAPRVLKRVYQRYEIGK